MVETDTAFDYVIRNQAWSIDCSFCLCRVRSSPVILELDIGMVSEVLFRGVVIAATGGMVTSADGFVQGLTTLVNIESKTAFASTRWTSVAGRYSFVFLQLVHIIRYCVHPSTAAYGMATVDGVDNVDSYSNSSPSFVAA